MKREVVVSGLGLSPDGLELTYMVLPDDVRSDGHVVLSRTAMIAYATPGPLGAAAQDLRLAVEGLGDLLEVQVTDLPVYEPPATETLSFGASNDDDPDEDVGMGDGR